MILELYLLSPEREASAAYLSNPSTTGIGIVIIATGASMAFCFNLAVYYFIAYTSALCARRRHARRPRARAGCAHSLRGCARSLGGCALVR